MLITLLLCHADILRAPLLYLSLYLKQNRSVYYKLLDQTRSKGNWEAWLVFFLQGIQETADDAIHTCNRISRIFASDRIQIEAAGRRTGSALRVHEVLMSRPLATIAEVCQRTNLTFPTVSAAMTQLVNLQIATEITGQIHNRIFAYHSFLSILAEGTEIV